MAYLEEVYDYKNKIIKLLIDNKEIVKTIDNKGIETPDELINNNIFKDLFLPTVQSDTKVYICLGIYVNRVYDDLIKDADLHFWIFSHQDIADSGLGYTRVDYIQSQIDKIMNGNYNFGIDNVELKYSRMFRPNEKFGGVELVYKVIDLNQDRCDGFDKFE